MGRYLGGLGLSWAPCFLGPRCPGLAQNSLHQGVQRLGGSISYTPPVCTTLSAFDRWWSLKKYHHLRRGFLLILQSFSPGCEVLSFLRTSLWLLKQRSSKDICCCSVPSRVQLFSTPWAAVCQVSSSFTMAQSLLKLMSIESMMPSNHLILCHPLLLLPSILPSIRVFSNESVLCISWPKYWSFSFSISPSNEYSGLISFRIDWFDFLAVQGTLKSLFQHHNSKASILKRNYWSNIGAVLLLERETDHISASFVQLQIFQRGPFIVLQATFLNRELDEKQFSWCKTYELYVKMRFLTTADCFTNGEPSCLREKIFPGGLSS